MNTLYIIGNGFDLAHGLKTSYSDFLLWYLKQCVDHLEYKGEYTDILLSFTGTNDFPSIEKINSPDELFRFLKTYGTKCIFFGEFIRNVFTDKNKNWVDIESEYYSSIISILENKNMFDTEFHNIKNYNAQFDRLKLKLIEYLNEINKSIIGKGEIQDHFNEDEFSNYKQDKYMVLNFNYTTTVDKYISNLQLPITRSINIHGKLNDPNNPIIFGYGDEMHHHYESLERLNDDKFLFNFKSFGYLRNSNYARFEQFINGLQYRVKILGHSCGLSDRVLLSTIFQHKNCRRIEICYHQISEFENDHYEKTIRISRHFSTQMKAEMRRRILPQDKSKALISIK